MTIRTEAYELVGLFPPGTCTDTDGTLMVGGCRLDDVAAQFGTPAIVVSEDALHQRARDYQRAFRNRWPRCDVAFASKSFPCTAVQRVMVEEGLHLDVAGGGEILTALKAGADPASCCTGTPRPTRNSSSRSRAASAWWSSTTSTTSTGSSASSPPDISSLARSA